MNSFFQRLKSVVAHSIAGAWIVGSFELVYVAMHSKLGLSMGEGLLLSFVALVWASILAAGWAVFAGGTLLFLARNRGTEARVNALAVGASMAGVCVTYLGPAALDQLEIGNTIVALVYLCSSVVIGVIFYLNVRYWMRRAEAMHPVKVSWWQGCVLVASAVCMLSSLALGMTTSGGSAGVVGDRNVLFISVDTLRRDHLSVYAKRDGLPVLAKTPRMDRLAQTGILFQDAVTPMPETAPAHGSMFTGKYPIDHGLISNGHRMYGGFETLAGFLRDQNYATSAFVSSFAVDSRTGLDRGFSIYDDDYAPSFRGISELQIFKVFSRLLMKFGNPERYGWLLERSGKRTNANALRWLRSRGEKPWMMWVHYFEPHAPYEAEGATVSHRDLLSKPGHRYTEEESVELRRLYALEVEKVDVLVGELLDTLEEKGLLENTVVVLVSDHGEQLGEHDIDFHHHGLYEESVRIPMILNAPFVEQQGVVYDQSRILDILPTLLSVMEFPALEGIEGVNLIDAVQDQAPLAEPVVEELGETADVDEEAERSDCLLMGRETPAQGGGMLLGQRNETLKYILNTSTGKELVFDLSKDRAEATDISGTQPKLIGAVRKSLKPIADRMGEYMPKAGTTDRERLRALGYLE